MAYLTQLADFLEALVGFTDVHSPLLSEVERGGLLRTEQPLNLPHFWQFMTVAQLPEAVANWSPISVEIGDQFATPRRRP